MLKTMLKEVLGGYKILVIVILLLTTVWAKETGVVSSLSGVVQQTYAYTIYDYNKDSVIREVKSQADRQRPVITYNTSQKIYANIPTNLDDLIQIKDDSNENLGYVIQKIQRSGGEDINDAAVINHTVTFPRSGIYTIIFTTVDTTNRIETMQLIIPVQKESEG